MQALLSELPIDKYIDPRAATVSSILRHVRRGRILDVYPLGNGAGEVIEGEVLDTSFLAGKKLEDIHTDGIAIGAVIQDGAMMRKEDNLIFKKGDRLVLMAEPSAVRQVEEFFRVSSDFF